MKNISRTEKHSSTTAGTTILRYNYTFSGENPREADSEHRLVDTLRISELIEEITGSPVNPEVFNDDYAFYRTGWQSWDAGWETLADERCPKYISFMIPALKKYIEVPETRYKKNMEYGQFIIWLRWNNMYLVAASTGRNLQPDAPLPPIQYELDRKGRCFSIYAYSNGKTWKNGENVAEISFFLAKSYFELKDTIRFLFRDARNGEHPGTNLVPNGEARFENLAFLGKIPGGWESWYNHYNKIDETLIQDDLNALNTTDNLIKLMYLDRNQPVVFQIDDGWQQGTGQWEINRSRFPHGFADLTAKIKEKGYIPGLWIAPFIFDYRVPFIKQRQDWILRDKKGKPIPAGFNAPWGAAIGKDQPAGPHNYFALDLSRDDVLEYLDALIDRAINEWGFRYLKLDFLFAGMIHGCFKNGGAAYEWYDRAVRTLTKRTKAADGEPVAYLGCGMPFESSYQYFPLSRIGADTKESWDFAVLKPVRFSGRPGAYTNMKDTLGHAFWNDAVYKNDPDVVFFRKENCTLTDNEKELIALVNYLFAGQIMHADDPARFSQEAEAPLTQKVLALYDKFSGVSFGNVRIAPDIYVIFSSDVKYTGMINLSDKSFTLPVKTLHNTAFLQAYGESHGSAFGAQNAQPRVGAQLNASYKLVAGQGTILGTADAAAGNVLTVPPHSIYIQENN